MKALPFSIQDFSKLRMANYLYVGEASPRLKDLGASLRN